MRVLGLTGSIGMGKSVASRHLRALGVPVQDADAAVHRLFAPGGAAVEAVEAAFPGVTTPAGAIDRGRLGQRVFGNPALLRRLESIVHPLVRRDRDRFLAAARRRRLPLVALDVPLLFESGGWRGCDAVVVMSCPSFLQKQRVLRRPGMTPERLRAILAQQMPDAEKRRRADWVVPSGLGRRCTLVRLRAIVKALRAGSAPCREGRR